MLHIRSSFGFLALIFTKQPPCALEMVTMNKLNTCRWKHQSRARLRTSTSVTNAEQQRQSSTCTLIILMHMHMVAL